MSTVITNYAPDPSAESGFIAINWKPYTAGTVTEDATEHASGTKSAKYVSTGSNQFEGLQFTQSSTGWTGAADVVTATIELKGTGTLNLAELRVGYTDASAVTSTPQTIVLSETFTKYTFSVTLNAAKTTDVAQLLLLRDETPAAFTLYADKYLLVKGVTPTPDYFDGDTTDTATDVYEWTGTPHASASTWTHTDPPVGASRIVTQFQLRPY